jgi:hypothetical protein
MLIIHCLSCSVEGVTYSAISEDVMVNVFISMVVPVLPSMAIS